MCHNPYFTGNSFAIEINFNRLSVNQMSQSLFYWKLLCNGKNVKQIKEYDGVTILILLETPLQFNYKYKEVIIMKGHNPYFTGNSFAISTQKPLNKMKECHNPYFTGNSFAIKHGNT